MTQLYHGVSVLAPNNQWTNYTKADLGLTNDDVWLSDLDNAMSKAGVWIGSYSPWTGSYGYGIIMLYPSMEVIRYTTTSYPDPTSNDILALLIDEEGACPGGRSWPERAFAGWSLGIICMKNSDIPEGAINSLAMDNSGRLWIGTDAGLVCSSN